MVHNERLPKLSPEEVAKDRTRLAKQGFGGPPEPEGLIDIPGLEGNPFDVLDDDAATRLSITLKALSDQNNPGLRNRARNQPRNQL